MSAVAWPDDLQMPKAPTRAELETLRHRLANAVQAAIFDAEALRKRPATGGETPEQRRQADEQLMQAEAQLAQLRDRLAMVDWLLGARARHAGGEGAAHAGRAAPIPEGGR